MLSWPLGTEVYTAVQYALSSPYKLKRYFHLFAFTYGVSYYKFFLYSSAVAKN